jgi:DNA-binding CsgD family transcriptional regulator/tetratricopeptide (TPR) repeat protein
MEKSYLHGSRLAQLHILLAKETNTRKRLDLWIEFLRFPGDSTLDEQLHEAGSAIASSSSNQHASQLAELHCIHADLLSMARKHNDALETMESASYYCDHLKGAEQATRRMEIGKCFERLGRLDLAHEAYTTAIEDHAPGKRPRGRSKALGKDLELWEARAVLQAEAYECLGGCLLLMFEQSAALHSEPKQHTDARKHAAARKPQVPIKHQKQLEEAIKAHQNALALREDLHRPDLAAVSYGALAHICIMLDRNEEASGYMERSLDAARASEYNDRSIWHLASAFEHIASAKLNMMEIDEARDHAQRARMLYEGLRRKHQTESDQHNRYLDGALKQAVAGIARTHTIQGNILEWDGEPEEAVKEYGEAHNLLNALCMRHLLPPLLITIADLHMAKKEYKEYNNARHALDTALQITIGMRDRRNEQRIRFKLSAAYEGMKRWEAALDEYKAAVAIGYGLANRENQEIFAKAQADFDRGQVERTEHRLREVQATVVFKANRLVMMAARLGHKNEVLKKLKRHIADAMTALDLKGLGPVRHELKEACREIDATIGSDEDWELFTDQIDELHPGVMRRLAELDPILTPTELRVCGLTILGLTAKEVAGVLAGSERTITTHIYHVKQKMGLTVDKTADKNAPKKGLLNALLTICKDIIHIGEQPYPSSPM